MLTKDNFSGTSLGVSLTNTVTVPITVNAGSNKFLYVLVASQNAPTGVTYAGTSLTNVLNESFGASLTHSTWTTSSPTIGTNNLNVSHASPAASQQINVQSFTDCLGLGNSGYSSGTVSPVTGTVAVGHSAMIIADGDLQVSGIGVGICNPLLWNSQKNGVWAVGGISSNLANGTYNVVLSGSIDGISPAGIRVWEVVSRNIGTEMIRI